MGAEAWGNYMATPLPIRERGNISEAYVMIVPGFTKGLVECLICRALVLLASFLPSCILDQLANKLITFGSVSCESISEQNTTKARAGQLKYLNDFYRKKSKE